MSGLHRVAIIPARGGSKRIPGKNIRIFCGRPIISYSICAARHSGLFDSVVVSTDDRQVADVARQHGARVPFLRPKELAGDEVPVSRAIAHTLTWLRDQGETYDYFCFIMATAPFVTAGDIRRGWEVMKERNADAAFAVTRYDYPIWRALRLNNEGRLEMVWQEYRDARSQDLPDVWHDAGQFYWAKTDVFLDAGDLMGGIAVPIVVPRYRAQDIDTEEDWSHAELLFRLSNLAGGGQQAGREDVGARETGGTDKREGTFNDGSRKSR